MRHALKGIRVLDLTRLLPGAVATQYLADHGAEVIKIEQPVTGDYAREMYPALFRRTNGGKKSAVFDLKKREDNEVVRAMAARADVLIESFRPGVMARLGLAYDDLRLLNERLIYVSLTGYGQQGELAGLAGHDVNYIAMGGLLGLNLPTIPGCQIADLAGGSMQAVMGILLALQARHRDGCGQFVDVSMTAGVTSLLTVPLAAYAETGREPEPGNELLSGRYACYHLYQAQDGRWLAVGALEPKFWMELCRQLGCEDLSGAQFEEERQAEATARLAGIFRGRDAEDWFELLRTSDCCVTPVRLVSEVAAALPPAEQGRRAPELGEHTEELIRQWKREGVRE